ncbi:MAG: peptide chain release factor 3 [Planctomycetaceae bacterium]
MECESDTEVIRELNRRRTFAIISHPDAGKTTLTEKLLLFGGCIEIAGAVRGRKSQRAATSDWLEMEQQRGISISSTALTFEFDSMRVNLLDTPGHHDFSEDTFRTLIAADCAVMVIDLAKGVESQTEKLFQVCALRKIPVITFVNKVDRTGQEPLVILDEIEAKLGIKVCPQNWPIGSGPEFRGLVNMETDGTSLFHQRDGSRRVAARDVPLDQLTEDDVDAKILRQAREEVELVRSAGFRFDLQAFRSGSLSPVFWGSALTNWGVEDFLRGFLRLCPVPGNRLSDRGPVPAQRSEFAGFVFKIQANLDPRHRDRIAFLRVCAGKFERDMEVVHSRTAKKIRIRRAHQLFGRDRETVEAAYPGDIIGLINPGEFRLGDTICVGTPVSFEPLPQFSPEHFAVLRCPDTMRRKQFDLGLRQLLEEGAVQMFHDPNSVRREPILGAVGELQFDVVRFRLESEYKVSTQIQWLPYHLARWILSDATAPKTLHLSSGSRSVQDYFGRPAILFEDVWASNYAARENPGLVLGSMSSTAMAPA